ncbi:MAG TPA: TetR/AcrR family transcriptional regulator [Burkholderiaceae bacterium]|nr:TetR/AcrR family transcriptional regulator [Burkholderiaceae bacterium]
MLDAAFARLAAGGLAGLSIADVARDAGVHETSIYRRWGTRERLAQAACLDRAERDIALPDTGAFDTDLQVLAEGAALFVVSPAGRLLLQLGLQAAAGGSDRRPAYWRERMAALAPVFDRAIARGEVRDRVHAQRCLEAAIAPIYLRALVSGERLRDWPLARFASAVPRLAAVLADDEPDTWPENVGPSARR